MRKSVSLNNLSQYEQPRDQDSNSNDKSDVKAVATGYASADSALLVAARNRARKRGAQWTEEEHKLFLLGLRKFGKGNWRGIARIFVETKTPTQVACHFQKYFMIRSLRRLWKKSKFNLGKFTLSPTP